MVDLIKNLKNKYNQQVQYLGYDNAGENVAFERACKQEGLGFTLNIKPQVCHNRMAALNKNLLPFLIGYMLCSMVGNSPQTYVTDYGLKLQTLHVSQK